MASGGSRWGLEVARLLSNGEGAIAVAAATRGLWLGAANRPVRQTSVSCSSGRLEATADACRTANGTAPCNLFRRMAPAQGCSGSSSSIWGERGTVQASQCCCVALRCRAAGGAFPERRHGQQPPSDAACRNCWSSRTSTYGCSIETRKCVCRPRAAKSRRPLLSKRRRA
jgi:hypothetical protein